MIQTKKLSLEEIDGMLRIFFFFFWTLLFLFFWTHLERALYRQESITTLVSLAHPFHSWSIQSHNMKGVRSTITRSNILAEWCNALHSRSSKIDAIHPPWRGADPMSLGMCKGLASHAFRCMRRDGPAHPWARMTLGACPRLRSSKCMCTPGRV